MVAAVFTVLGRRYILVRYWPQRMLAREEMARIKGFFSRAELVKM
ncbi:MAG: hypothetical protein ACE5IA_03480 [Dehalococcoidia bacterium]